MNLLIKFPGYSIKEMQEITTKGNVASQNEMKLHSDVITDEISEEMLKCLLMIKTLYSM